jgi:hypothetical protein
LSWTADLNACAIDDYDYYGIKSPFFDAIPPLIDKSDDYYYDEYAPTEAAESEADKETYDFWYGYCNGKVSRDDIKAYFSGPTSTNSFYRYLKANLKTSAIRYITFCQRLKKVRDAVWESRWDYESMAKDDAMRSYRQLYQQVVNVKADKDLSSRYIFLKMRLLHALKDYNGCISLWQNEVVNLPDSPIKTRIEGYVGGAYYFLGNYVDALDIFYRVSDVNSISWCVNKLIGFDNMVKLYETKPESPALLYVVQDFVNYLIKALCSRDASLFTDKDSYYYDVAYESVVKDAERFRKFALQASKSPKTNNPALWLSAAGYIGILKGDVANGYQELLQASEMDAPHQTALNTRRLLLFARLKQPIQSNDFEYYLADEIDYLCKEYQAHDSEYNWIAYFTMICDLAKDYLIENNNASGAMALVNALPGYEMIQYGYNETTYLRFIWKMPLAQLKAYAEELTHKSTNYLTRKMRAIKAPSLDLVYDVIGTRLMKEERFAEAAQYLSKVSPQWIVKSNYFPYIYKRSLYVNKPFQRNICKSVEDNLPRQRNYSGNPKLEACKQLESARLRSLNGSSTDKFNYAKMLFQASEYGDMWALTNYEWSSGAGVDSTKLFDIACRLLENLKEGDEYKLESMMALLQINSSVYADERPWESGYWDGYSYNPNIYVFYMNTKYMQMYQQEAKVLGRYMNRPFIRSCDVLRAYLSSSSIKTTHSYDY